MSMFVQQINFKISKSSVQKVLDSTKEEDVYISIGVEESQSFRVAVSSEELGTEGGDEGNTVARGCPTPPGCKTN